MDGVSCRLGFGDFAITEGEPRACEGDSFAGVAGVTGVTGVTGVFGAFFGREDNKSS